MDKKGGDKKDAKPKEQQKAPAKEEKRRNS